METLLRRCSIARTCEPKAAYRGTDPTYRMERLHVVELPTQKKRAGDPRAAAVEADVGMAVSATQKL